MELRRGIITPPVGILSGLLLLTATGCSSSSFATIAAKLDGGANQDGGGGASIPRTPEAGTPDGGGGPNTMDADVTACGNGVLNPGERCDDGNNEGDDGCSSDCSTIGEGYRCPEVGTLCVTDCGNDSLDFGESCDDGNLGDGDGCSSTCAEEAGWDCSFSECTASECGDGIVAGGEECDDGARLSGDGCSYRCTREPGFVCITGGVACREAVCGDGAIEADEQCDDGNDEPSDGCDMACQLESGYVCRTPGVDCAQTECGDGVVEGTESCDDGNAIPADGCDAACQLEAGFKCPGAGVDCVATECGDGLVEGLESCDDMNDVVGDGCGECRVEPLYECAGAPSACLPSARFVRITEFPAPMAQPQAVHYDPTTRSFIAYGFNQDQGYQEVCLDGTLVAPETRYRPRDLVGQRLDGATYDPFNDRFLFIEQDGDLTEIERQTGEVVRTANLEGVGTAGGVAVGDDGRLYVCNHFEESIKVFERFDVSPSSTIPAPTSGPYLDNLYTIPGEGLIGYYNLPPGESEQQFAFHRYDGSLVGRSTIPGVLFANGRPFPRNSDGGEGAPDGGYFLVCSEYKANGTAGEGICQLFSRACASDSECAARVPGTACKLDAEIPYCYAPAIARNDGYDVEVDSEDNSFDVLVNDTPSEAVCKGSPVRVVGVTAGDQGGTIAVADGGGSVVYSPAKGFCGGVETFTYDADLGGITDTATVRVRVRCPCGDGTQQVGEQCDDGNTEPGDGCSPACELEAQCGNALVEPGEECDDGNVEPGDGCSPTCSKEGECGDGKLDPGESCDDGNTEPGDGCSPTCYAPVLI